MSYRFWKSSWSVALVLGFAAGVPVLAQDTVINGASVQAAVVA